MARHYRGDIPLRPLGPAGRPPEVLTYRDNDDLKRQLRRVLNRLVGVEGVAPADIAVLTPRALERSALPGTSLEGGLVLVPGPVEGPGPMDVRLSSIHRFKGLEASVVVLAELEAADGPERDALLYVGFSRARSHLIVLALPEAAAALGGAAVAEAGAPGGR